MYKKFIGFIIICSFMLLFVGCSSSTTTSTKKAVPELTVAAAADLTKAFTEIGTVFEKQNNCKVTFSFGSTGTLSEQIENGAPFDVLAAANVEVIDKLIKKDKVIADTQQLYGIGRIGVTTKKDSEVEAKGLEDLLKLEIKKIAIANPDHAPYGLAAKQALESAGLWEQLKDKMVYGKNISETLTYLTTGNVDAGIIALSLYNKDEVEFSLIDDKLHKPLKQAMAVVKGTKHEELARQFVKFVNEKEGREIMKEYGFVLPGETK